MRKGSIIALLLTGLFVTGCNSQSSHVETATPSSSPPKLPAARRIDLEEQRQDATRSAQHLSSEEQTAQEQSAQKAKQAAPVAVESFENNNMANTLAKLDGVAQDETRIKRFQTLLSLLDDKYSENQQQIGDLTADAKKGMHVKGVDESCLSILEGLNQVCDGKASMSYAETATNYTAVRAKGQSHAEAVGALRKIMSRFRER